MDSIYVQTGYDHDHVFWIYYRAVNILIYFNYIEIDYNEKAPNHIEVIQSIYSNLDANTGRFESLFSKCYENCCSVVLLELI